MLGHQKKVVEIVKAEYPETPIILYISGSAGVLERMAKTGVDIISLDWTVDIEEACKRILAGLEFKVMLTQAFYSETKNQ